jgi:hypothetical protein
MDVWTGELWQALGPPVPRVGLAQLLHRSIGSTCEEFGVVPHNQCRQPCRQCLLDELQVCWLWQAYAGLEAASVRGLKLLVYEALSC